MLGQQKQWCCSVVAAVVVAVVVELWGISGSRPSSSGGGVLGQQNSDGDGVVLGPQ